jgi:hypothetical protein
MFQKHSAGDYHPWTKAILHEITTVGRRLTTREVLFRRNHRLAGPTSPHQSLHRLHQFL